VGGIARSVMEEKKNCCCLCGSGEETSKSPSDKSCERKVKLRSAEEKKALLVRLKRIEGQVRGIYNMVENDAYCADILTQAAAVNAAMNSFNKQLLSSHMRSCVVENIKNGNEEVIDELVALLQKLMK